MDKNNLNIVVFDEEDSFVGTEQSRYNNSVVRRQTSEYGFGASNQQGLISNEIQMLNDKIRSLQDKTNKIQESLRTPTLFSASAISSASSIHHNHHSVHNTSHIDQLLRVIETKIKVIIEETKKIIQKLSNQFDKKLSQSVGHKDRQQTAIIKIQKHCRDSISQIEKHYQQQLMLVKDEHQQLEQRLIERVQEMEREYRKKLKNFQSKEGQYLSTIQHLQNKVRMANKGKKMLQITQEKPNLSIRCDMLENISGVNNTNNGHSINGLSPHDTSMSKRRTKIFDSKRSNKSVSPNNAATNNNQVLSPFKTANIEKPKQSQSVAKVAGQKQLQHQAPESNYYPSTSIKSELSPEFKGSQYQNHQNSKMIPESQYISREMSRPQSVKTFVKDESEQEFYKDVPKPQWERFQDYNENDSSGSEQDVFFYPQHIRNQKQEPQQVFNYGQSSNKDKMFSPFDVN